MRIYGTSCPVGKRNTYNYIQQIALNPDDLEWFIQGYIIWYKDLEDNQPLDVYLGDISEFFVEDWKIWECCCRIFNCKFENKILSQEYENYDGVIELEYKEGKFKSLKYWKCKDDYLNNRSCIKETIDPFV